VTTPRTRLGLELRRLRELADLSGRQLKAKIGISQSKISRIESGDKAVASGGLRMDGRHGS
jgi:transcriptional regulator with XRE-family HTH domain